MKTPPRIIAHRGASVTRHENTMAAFEQAIADGADGIEFDLRLTNDRQWVVHHDAAIPIGGVPARIRDLSMTDLTKLTVGSDNDPVPTLAEFLAWAGARKIPVVFDIKDSVGIPELISTIETTADPVEMVFSAFRRSVLVEIKRRRPKWRTALIVGNPRWRVARQLLTGSLLSWARRHGAFALHLHERWITPDLIVRAHAAGINLAVWTVDDPVRIGLLAHLGIDAIITNDPKRGREIIDRTVSGIQASGRDQG